MSKGGLIAKFASVGAATMASRVLGLAREAMMAAVLAAGPVADVFYTCFRFPNVFRRLFAEGAFNIAFVPLFASELEEGGEEAAQKFAQQIFAVFASWLILLTAIAILFMPFLVMTIVAPGFTDTPEKFELSVTMTRIMFPYLLCMSLMAMFSGILNSMRRYFFAAIVPVTLNVVLVAILVAAWWLETPARTIGLALAWGVLISGIAQMGALWWAVRREGMRFSLAVPRLSKPVKRLLVLMGPALLIGGVLQINILIGTIIATAQDGANALLNYADRINQLPLGIIGAAIGVVLLPELSRALTAGDDEEAVKLQNRSLEFALVLTVPAAIGLILLPEAIVALLYERGAFTAETTAQTARALIAFATGLPAYVLLKVFQPAFFARKDMRTPLYLSVLMVVVNVALSLALFPSLGYVAIAIATSISSWVNVVGLAAVLWMRGLYRPDALVIRRVFLIIFGSAVLAGLLLVMQPMILEPLRESGFLIRMIALGAVIAGSMVVYFGLMIVTNVIDRTQLKRLMKRRGSTETAT